jgi:hypothetical protein
MCRDSDFFRAKKFERERTCAGTLKFIFEAAYPHFRSFQPLARASQVTVNITAACAQPLLGSLTGTFVAPIHYIPTTFGKHSVSDSLRWLTVVECPRDVMLALSAGMETEHAIA